MPFTPSATTPAGWRVLVFRVVATLVGLLLLPAAVGFLSPFVQVDPAGLSHPASARWSIGLEGSVDLMTALCLFSAAVHPQHHPAAVRYVGTAALLAAAVVTPFTGPTFLLICGMLLLVVACYPWPGVLLERSGVRLPVLTAGVVAGGVLVPIAIDLLQRQRLLPRGTDPDLNILVTDAEHILLLVLAILVASLRSPGSTWLATLAAGTLAYLGVAAMLLQHQPESWGLAGGLTALAGALAIVAVARLNGRRDEPRAAGHSPAQPADSSRR